MNIILEMYYFPFIICSLQVILLRRALVGDRACLDVAIITCGVSRLASLVASESDAFTSCWFPEHAGYCLNPTEWLLPQFAQQKLVHGR